MIKKIILIAALTTISSICFGEESITVTLPEFDITINGTILENNQRTYPLLLHNDITYVPMTWFDCRFLGVKTNWNLETGLSVSTSNVTASYHDYITEPTSLTKATHPAYDVTVNDAIYKDEAYPFIVYESVTYMPLTWALATENFGWTYSFDQKKGLVIDSTNPKIEIVKLPSHATLNDVYYYKEAYYFVKTDETYNYIYKAQTADILNPAMIYQYEYSTSYGDITPLDFYEKSDKLWFKYHRSGTAMGSDVFCYINEDGTVTEKHNGYLDFSDSEYGDIIISFSVPPGPSNLWKNTNGKIVKLGDASITYGWYIHLDDKQKNMSQSTNSMVIDNHLYVLGSDEVKGQLNRLYQIDLTTGTSRIVVDQDLVEFNIINDRIYYISSENGHLYSSLLNGKLIETMYDQDLGSLSNWQMLNEHSFIYYSKEDKIPSVYLVNFTKGYKKKIGEGVVHLYTNSKNMFVQLDDQDYGMIVYDYEGNDVLRITDQIVEVYVVEELILLKTEDEKIIKITLN